MDASRSGAFNLLTVQTAAPTAVIARYEIPTEAIDA
jgi:hypothetical protein